MKSYNNIILSVSILFFLIGCYSNINKCGYNQPNKPVWIYKIPKSNDKFIYFVGLSNENVSSEKKARNESLNDAREQLVHYLGTDVKNKMEEIIISINLSSKKIDPIVLSQEYEKQFAENVARNVHGTEFYVEYKEKDDECVCKVFTLCSVPTNIAMNSISEFANSKLQTTDEYIELWSKLKKSVDSD